MSEFNFNSQICTDKNQSERLLALGLKKETADCMHNHCWTSEDGIVDDIPAWSLHRLAFLLNASPYPIYLDSNAYSDIIDDIEELIRHGEFNKEYLVNQSEIDEHCKGVLEYLDYIRGEE